MGAVAIAIADGRLQRVLSVDTDANPHTDADAVSFAVANTEPEFELDPSCRLEFQRRVD